MNSQIVYVGIDVSKAKLDAHIGKRVSTYQNSISGIGKLRKAIDAHSDCCHLVFESTGGYERLAAWTLLEAGYTASIVNAARVRSFAESMGQLAKTDPIDAKVITRFAESVQPRPSSLPPASLRALAARMKRRKELDDQRCQETNRLDTIADKDMRRNIEKHVRWLKRELASLDKEIDAVVDQDPQQKEKAAKIQSITGYGRVCALSLLAYMPELGTVSRKRIAALAGLAPYNKDSGKMSFKRHIRGGRKHLRDSLYMGAVSAITHNPHMRSFYNHLIQDSNKPKKVAIVAVMRKMLIAANSLLKDPDFSLAQ